MVKAAIHKTVEFEWKCRLECDASISEFSLIHSHYEPCTMWQLSRVYRNLKLQCKSSFSLMCSHFSKQYLQTCYKCAVITPNLAMHSLMYCSSMDTSRHVLWMNLCRAMGIELYSVFTNLSAEMQLIQLFNGLSALDIPSQARVDCFSYMYFVRFAHKVQTSRFNISI